MVLSSGVLISRFGVSGNSLSASAIAQPRALVQTGAQVKHPILTTVNPLSSAYLALGNTIIGASNASLRGYVMGIHMWVNTMPRIANTSTRAVFAVGESLERAVGTTVTVVPDIYLKGIYTIGNGLAYLSIKSATANSLASVELSNLFVAGNNGK